MNDQTPNGPQFQAPGSPNSPGHFVGGQQPAPTPAKKSRGKVIALVGVVAFASWAIGACQASLVGGGDGTAAAPAPTVTVTQKGDAKPEPAPTVTVTAKAEAPKEEKTEEAKTEEKAETGSATLTDGSFEIGSGDPEKVAPGKYRTVEPLSGEGYELCYVDVQTDSGDYLAQEVTDKGHTIVTVAAKGDTVSVSGCGDFKKIG